MASTNFIKELIRKISPLSLFIAKNILRKLGLLKKGKLLRAAEVLFCKNNPLEVQMAIFAGEDKLTFLDIRQLKGNIFFLLKETELYIKDHIRWRVRFGKLEREEIPEIPVDALREALVNSLCHRDYYRPESNKISIFKNRIEIYNPGNFPEGLTPDDFIKGEEESVLRNPKIAGILYFSKDIEKFGSGLKRIHQQCAAAKIKVKFSVRRTGFFVTFFRPDWESPLATRAAVAQASAEEVRRKYGENTHKVWRVIAGNLFIKTREIASKTCLSQRTVENVVAKLKKAGILKRIGPDKGGHWEIVK